MIFKKGNRFLSAQVTHLEMIVPCDLHVPAPVEGAACLVRVTNCPVHFYRYLYERIGKAHHWTMRLKKTDAALEEIIHSQQTILQIFYVDGCPAGFVEVNLRDWPVAEILYFGIMSDFQGRGLARFFLNQVVVGLWALRPEKLIIQTNTLDSPLALPLYQKMGFEVVLTREVILEAWPD